MTFRNFFFLFVVLFVSGCSSPAPVPETDAHRIMMNMPCHQMPDGTWMGNCEDQGEQFSQSVEGLPDAVPTEVVELQDGDVYSMTAEIVKKEVNGKQLRMLAYNKQIPGPTLKVPQDAEVTLRFENQTDIETLFHSHGLRLDNRFDGTHLTQEPIQQGEVFEYKLRFPDAGVYWYHPHIREDYTQESGLYGNYLVVPKDDQYWSEVDKEEMLVLDDLLLDATGKLDPFYEDKGTFTLMGRYGNTVFVNGQTQYTDSFTQGERVRFFVTNVANTRTFFLKIPGVQIKLVGADASKYEREEFVDAVVLAPSERIVVELFFENAGEFVLQNALPNTTQELARFSVQAVENVQDSDSLLRENQDVIAEIDQVRSFFDKAPDKEIRFDIDMGGMMNMDHSAMGHSMDAMHGGDDHHEDDEYAGVEWEDQMPQMNLMSDSTNMSWNIIDQQTGKQNMDIDWTFNRGEYVKIRLYNDPNTMHPMQHPFHIHGQRFLVLETDGVKNQNLAWKDTTLIRSGETVDILVEMSNPGEWMAHCHIAEHLEAGMMMGFTVL